MDEYVRADLVQAAVAVALREAAGVLRLYAEPGVALDYSLTDEVTAILALITPDAQAALDRYVKERSDEVVAAERERCARVAEQKAGAGSHAIAATIRKGRE
jgi:uncharacterized membrane protein